MAREVQVSNTFIEEICDMPRGERIRNCIQ